MAGRQRHSLTNFLGRVVPVVFRKDGNVAVAAFGGRIYNEGNTPLVISKIVASVGTAPTGASAIFDVKINGTTVFAAAGDRPTITATNFRGATTATKTGKAITVNPGEYVTAEATQVGSTVAGADPRVEVFFS